MEGKYEKAISNSHLLGREKRDMGTLHKFTGCYGDISKDEKFFS